MRERERIYDLPRPTSPFINCNCSHQVFIRELISNGSDALEKLRHKLMTSGGETAQMEIHLQTDGAKGTFTIQVYP